MLAVQRGLFLKSILPLKCTVHKGLKVVVGNFAVLCEKSQINALLEEDHTSKKNIRRVIFTQTFDGFCTAVENNMEFFSH